MIAKLILYASQTLFVPEIAVDEPGSDDLFAVWPTADVPWPGSRVEPGEPVMTLLASGESSATCQSRLIELEQYWMSRLGIGGAPTPNEP